MIFDIKKFEANISKYKVNKEDDKQVDDSGMARVISSVWNHESIDTIDFDSFTHEDVISSLDSMEEIAIEDHEEDEEVFIVNPDNPFIIHAKVESAIYNMCNCKNKVYENEDDDVFI